MTINLNFKNDKQNVHIFTNIQPGFIFDVDDVLGFFKRWFIICKEYKAETFIQEESIDEHSFMPSSMKLITFFFSYDVKIIELKMSHTA